MHKLQRCIIKAATKEDAVTKVEIFLQDKFSDTDSSYFTIGEEVKELWELEYDVISSTSTQFMIEVNKGIELELYEIDQARKNLEQLTLDKNILDEIDNQNYELMNNLKTYMDSKLDEYNYKTSFYNIDFRSSTNPDNFEELVEHNKYYLVFVDIHY